MSKWQAEKAERNRRSLARLNRALPGIFPSAVLSWALSRPFVPPTPRLAINSVLARPSDPRRSAGACTCSSERSAQRLDLAARRHRQAWIASHI